MTGMTQTQIAMQDVTSSNIKAIGWGMPDPPGGRHTIGATDTGTLRIEFLNGSIYEHADVPYCVYVGVLGAPSIGGAYNVAIKGKYAHRKVLADAKDRPVVVDETAVVTREQFEYVLGRAVKK